MSASSPEPPRPPPNLHFEGGLPEHGRAMAEVAHMCRRGDLYTDVRLVARDGEVAAHRIVLASCSQLLRKALASAPEGMPELTVMVPTANRESMQILVDFLYTGKMRLSKNNTSDLQRLVAVLEIDPVNITIFPTAAKKDHGHKPRSPAPVQPQRPEQENARLAPTDPTTENTAEPSSKTSKTTSSSSSDRSGCSRTEASLSSPPPSIPPQKAPKRKALPDEAGQDKHINGMKKLKASNVTQKEKTAPGRRSHPQKEPRNNHPPAHNSSASSSRRQSGPRPSSRPRSLPRATPPDKRKSGASGNGSSPTPRKALSGSGVHDEGNDRTWKCTICRRYDPKLPRGAAARRGGGSKGSGNGQTEWIGCDCNRWYHVLCTKVEDEEGLENFSCELVNIKCLLPDGSDQKSDLYIA